LEKTSFRAKDDASLKELEDVINNAIYSYHLKNPESKIEIIPRNTREIPTSTQNEGYLFLIKF
jgi:hypothetical protein